MEVSAEFQMTLTLSLSALLIITNGPQWSRKQLWIGGAKMYWEGWTKTTLISNESTKTEYTHTGYNGLLS